MVFDHGLGVREGGEGRGGEGKGGEGKGGRGRGGREGGRGGGGGTVSVLRCVVMYCLTGDGHHFM